MARSISEELHRHEPTRNVEFAIQSSLLADGDSRLLRIVLENLLRNAWKYTAGHEKARIEVGSRIEGRAVVYYVRDDGAGFDVVAARRSPGGRAPEVTDQVYGFAPPAAISVPEYPLPARAPFMLEVVMVGGDFPVRDVNAA